MDRDARHVLTELLVLRIQAGEAQAFTELHALWTQEIRRLAAARLRDPGVAEEVGQDTWIAIARGLRRLQDPACFPRWAFRILDRRCNDWLRRRGATRRREPDEVFDANLAVAPPPRSPDDDDAVERLRVAIARLDPAARTLLHLFYDANLPIAAIADVLDVPIGTIKSRLFSLRQTLGRQLQRETTQ